MRCSDVLPPSRRASLCFAWRYHALRLSFRSRSPRRTTAGQGLVSGIPSRKESRGEDQDLPSSWGILCAYAVFSDPGRTGHTLPGRYADAALAASKAKAPAGSTLEAQSHGLGTGCLRFVRWVTPPGRKTRFRLLAKLYRVGLATHRIPTKGFRDNLFLLPQALLGAMTLYANSWRCFG